MPAALPPGILAEAGGEIEAQVVEDRGEEREPGRRRGRLAARGARQELARGKGRAAGHRVRAGLGLAAGHAGRNGLEDRVALAVGAGLEAPGRGQEGGDHRRAEVGGQVHGAGVRGEHGVEPGDGLDKPGPVRGPGQVADLRGQPSRQACGQLPAGAALAGSAQDARMGFRPLPRRDQTAWIKGSSTPTGRLRRACRPARTTPRPPPLATAGGFTDQGATGSGARWAQKSTRLSPASSRRPVQRKANSVHWSRRAWPAAQAWPRTISGAKARARARFSPEWFRLQTDEKSSPARAESACRAAASTAAGRAPPAWACIAQTRAWGI